MREGHAWPAGRRPIAELEREKREDRERSSAGVAWKRKKASGLAGEKQGLGKKKREKGKTKGGIKANKIFPCSINSYKSLEIIIYLNLRTPKMHNCTDK